jgi:hypothetical protein
VQPTKLSFIEPCSLFGALRRGNELGSIGSTSVIRVEADNNVVLVLNQVLALNPARVKAIFGYASVKLESVAYIVAPTDSITVASSVPLGVGQEIKNAEQRLSEGCLVASLVGEVIEVLISSLGRVPDLDISR